MHGLAAGLGHRGPLPFFFAHIVNLAAQRGHPLRKARHRRRGFAGERGVHPLEQPGIAKRAAADHDPVAAGGGEQFDRAFGRSDVAVGKDRDRNSPLDFGNRGRVNRRDVHLFPRAAVYNKQVGPVFLAGFGDGRAGQVVGIPADAHLDGQRPLPAEGFPRGFDNRAAARGVQQQLASRPAAGDLGRGAPHVYIQDIKPEPFFQQDFDGPPDRLGFAAEQLHGVYAVGVAVAQQIDALVVAEGDRLGAGHLADRPGCAVVGHQAAAGGVAQTCHWGKRRPGGDG